ncbi:hypothetical protein [Corynebacterium variabile]|uniref:Secreted protein n=1 Tax=Corynebacterium variabile TaxID=1727 RepID=A0A4Y4BZY6_9CORY|nr:hypothetical protein [Corynebacterium variabile]GEC86381.1 hypothetical protein CVA01_16950 [Corynebacterium variabile]
MTIKKTLFTVGTATAVAIAGTGVASAQETAETPDSSAPTAGSAELSKERDVFGSITGADVLGSWTGDQLDYGKTITALASLAAGAASVAAIAGAYNAVIDASDAYQGVIDNTVGFLAQQGITLPN